MLTRCVRLVLVLILSACVPARADDAFFQIPAHRLQITEGTLPKSDPRAQGNWTLRYALQPYAVLDGPGEVYPGTSDELTGPINRWRESWTSDSGLLVVRAPAGAVVSGWLFAPKADWSGMSGIKFKIPASAATPEARRDFFRIKEMHYAQLQATGNPGGAWFRRQVTQAHRALGTDAPSPGQGGPRAVATLDDTYELFSGGRAVSESLQLSRDLPAVRSEPEHEAMVPVAGIEGITVAAMDWAGLMGQTAPELDPLAAAIPADQHAVFFPSFEAMRTVANTSATDGLPIFRTFLGRAEDGRILERYQRQLGLELNGLSQVLGPKLIQSIAVTGSDPYFPTGTDVAVLFQTGDPNALSALIAAQVRAVTAGTPGTAASKGDAEGIVYSGLVSDDRSVCSYVATLSGTVAVVTNSVEQLRRLAAVQKGSASALSGLDEYKFFRQRYPRAANAETGFVFLSDATIRRWCGPAWRIGASRRLRAGAVMSDLTAAHADELAGGVKTERPVESETPMRTIGDLTIGPGGIRSSVYGTLRFLTPIAELRITEVAADEEAAYNRWRDGYQRNWNWAFDPIGATFTITPEQASADLTVMPLIVGTQYRSWIEVIRGASIGPAAGDPHDAVIQAVMALNVEARAMKEAASFAAMMARGVDIDPFGWLGHSVSLYADPGPFWQELAEAPGSPALENSLFRAPIGLYAEVGSAVKLTAFLAAARAFIEQSAPGMTTWESRTYQGQAYVRVGMSEQARAGAPDPAMQDFAVYYAPTGAALLASLDENVLKRAIDRQAARSSKQASTEPQWLGSSMCLRFNQAAIALADAIGGTPNPGQRQAWANLAILNEWKRRYPERDPLEIHAALWGTRLIGGPNGYRWNDAFKTMESVAYGHPGEPKKGPASGGTFGAVSGGDFGITFEDRGLRARAAVTRIPAER